MIAQEKCGNLRKDRQTAKLGSGLEKSLSAYAVAAVATGVSLLAMTGSAEAKIVYTPADTNIPVNNRESVLLDLNHDGIADFSFWNSSFRTDGLASSLGVGCALVAFHTNRTCWYQENDIWGKGVVSGRFASALRAGFMVGANKSYFQQARFGRGAGLAAMARFWASYRGSGTIGQWMYTKDRYLGLQFVIGGQVHYGWARVAVMHGIHRGFRPR